MHYRFVTKHILASHKHAQGVRMRSDLKGLRVSMIYVLGTTIAYTILMVGLISVVVLAFSLMDPEVFLEEQIGMGDPLGDLPQWLSLAVIAALYLSVCLLVL